MRVLSARRVTILDALAKAAVAFVALKENSERTREDLAWAKSSGRKLARPKGSLSFTAPRRIPFPLGSHQGQRLFRSRCVASQTQA